MKTKLLSAIAAVIFTVGICTSSANADGCEEWSESLPDSENGCKMSITYKTCWKTYKYDTDIFYAVRPFITVLDCTS